jgi:hypothetical protein
MRRVAEDLADISKALPSRAKAQRLELDHMSDRLMAVAVALTTEAGALDAKNSGLIARVGRNILIGGLALLGGMTTGAAEGGTAALIQRADGHAKTAVICVDRVERSALELEMAVEGRSAAERFDDLASGLRSRIQGLFVRWGNGPNSPPSSVQFVVDDNSYADTNRAQKLSVLRSAVLDYPQALRAEKPDNADEIERAFDNARVELGTLQITFDLVDGQARERY